MIYSHVGAIAGSRHDGDAPRAARPAAQWSAQAVPIALSRAPAPARLHYRKGTDGAVMRRRGTPWRPSRRTQRRLRSRHYASRRDITRRSCGQPSRSLSTRALSAPHWTANEAIAVFGRVLFARTRTRFAQERSRPDRNTAIRPPMAAGVVSSPDVARQRQ